MINIHDLIKNKHFDLVTGPFEKDELDINCIYCGDLLSWVMTHIPKHSLWFTVMGYINTVAIAKLCDVSMIVLCEDATLDKIAKEKAIQEKICIIKTSLPVFEASNYLKTLI